MQSAKATANTKKAYFVKAKQGAKTGILDYNNKKILQGKHARISAFTGSL
jgi:hypothetical protein